MSAVEDVQDRLQAQSLVDGGTGWESVRGVFHAKHGDRVVSITEDGGPVPEIKKASGLGDGALGDAGVHCMVRGEPRERDAAFAKAEAIRGDLHGLTDVTLGSTDYYRVRAMTQEPVWNGQDDDERPIYTISFRLMADA